MQKTAYEMRISDWRSDVYSSDLARPSAVRRVAYPAVSLKLTDTSRLGSRIGGLKGRVHSMFRLFKHYVPYAVVWLALIEFAALLLSGEAEWYLYAYLSDLDAGPIGDRWLHIFTFPLSNRLAIMAVGIYVKGGVRWLGLIGFAALLLSAEAAWHLYAHLSDFDAGPIGDRWLPLFTFALANSLAMMAVGMYGTAALRWLGFATARLLAAISLGVIFLSVLRFLLPAATLWRANSFYAMLFAIGALFLIRLLLTQTAGADAFRRRILVLGAGPRAARLAALAAEPGSGLAIGRAHV